MKGEPSMKRHTKTVKSFSKPPLTTNNNNNNTPLTSSVHAARSYDPDMLQMITPNAAGIDVASEEMWVCVPADRAEPNVRTFGAFTADLEAIADWLRQCRITSVAMESTGCDV
jgi:hypothetical protein